MYTVYAFRDQSGTERQKSFVKNGITTKKEAESLFEEKIAEGEFTYYDITKLNPQTMGSELIKSYLVGKGYKTH